MSEHIKFKRGQYIIKTYKYKKGSEIVIGKVISHFDREVNVKVLYSSVKHISNTPHNYILLIDYDCKQIETIKKKDALNRIILEEL